MNANADAAVHAAHQCVLQEIREPHAHGRAVHGLVQLREAAQVAKGPLAGHGCGHQPDALEHDEPGRNDRRELAETRPTRAI